MKILVSPDSYKGSLSATAAADAIAAGVHRVFPDAEVDRLPIADGGEGTVDCLLQAVGGQKVQVPVHDPLGRPITSSYGVLPDGTVVIEVAAAVGLHLVAERDRDVYRSHTRGVGELIADALDNGHTSFVVGLGGSATNDAGLGMLAALGARLYDAEGKALDPTPHACRALAQVDLSQLHPLLHGATIRIACDVQNPLCGPSGATAVYGPQKGVKPEWIPVLDGVLARFADVMERDHGVGFKDLPGAGAAGGLGGALAGVLGGHIVKGIDLVMDVTDFGERLRKADLLITGEGKTDSQTLSGKAVMGLATRAKGAGVPVLCLSGWFTEDAIDALYEVGVDAVMTLVPGPVTLDEAMQGTERYLIRATQAALRVFSAGMRMGR